MAAAQRPDALSAPAVGGALRSVGGALGAAGGALGSVGGASALVLSADVTIALAAVPARSQPIAAGLSWCVAMATPAAL